MYRSVLNDLATWYESRKHKILYIKGAYGVGKTWTVKDFATAYFDVQIYIDLTEDNEFENIFNTAKYSNSVSTMRERIIALDNLLIRKFGTVDASSALIIIDGIQDTYNCDEFLYEYSKYHRSYNICVIEDSMKISEYQYHYRDVFEIIRMRPLTFEEYMIARKATPFLAAISSSKNTALSSMEIDALCNMLQEYMLIGGMPKIVQHYIKTKSLSKVQTLQQEYLDKYEQIIKQSAPPAMAQRMRRVWKSIPEQLTHDNKKFMYKFVEDNARAREYETAVQKLCDLGLVRRLPRLKNGVIPLEDHVDYKSFELFLIDHGLLRTMYKLSIKSDLKLTDIICAENNAIAEQFIFEELSAKCGNIYYWISGATARVPFVYDGGNAPIPVEIRFTPNKKAQNIKVFKSKFPSTELSIKISLDQVFLDDGVLNIPAFGIWNM